MKFTKNRASHKPIEHGGIYSIRKTPNIVIDFSSNVNPLGCPGSVRRLFRSWMDKISVYPDHDSLKLKKHIARYCKASSDNVVVGNGAIEIIYNFCSIVVDKNKPILIPIPTFGEYEAASRMCGANPRFFKTMNLEKDLVAFIKEIPLNGLVFICNPNNPNGVMTSKASLKIIIKSAKLRNTFVFVDECFIELTQDQDQSVLDQVKKFDNLFVLRSLTKSFGLAGLRLGYGIGNPKLASILNKIKIPWSVNGIAQEAAVLALSDNEFLAKSRKLITKESFFLKDSISKIEGFDCFDSSTNFILIKTWMNAKLLQKKLLQKNILVRDCSNFKGLGKNYIRIAVKSHKENQRLVDALATIK